jgi:hypothetical protein
MSLRFAPSAALLTAGLLLAGCGAPPSPQPEHANVLAEAPATAVADIAVLAGTLSVPTGPADITLADVEAYERALEFRTVELQRSSDELQQARAANDLDRELTLLLYMSSRDLDRKTAAASGLDQERYIAVARILQNAADRLDSIERMEQTAADTRNGGDAEHQLAQARMQVGDPYAGFRPEVAKALRTRLPTLLARQREQAGILLQPAG